MQEPDVEKLLEVVARPARPVPRDERELPVCLKRVEGVSGYSYLVEFRDRIDLSDGTQATGILFSAEDYGDESFSEAWRYLAQLLTATYGPEGR